MLRDDTHIKITSVLCGNQSEMKIWSFDDFAKEKGEESRNFGFKMCELSQNIVQPKEQKMQTDTLTPAENTVRKMA